ncbi:MAG TPA: fumarylacetoacetate hydrolase family protein [Solirubrobacteraceae bacterium]|jgi:2-keto-4-pentenoate hydratase/2-oxohepta-3-ene-1,7-dioic acid hydratase in catechol pathway|nr:fumarylacetoacetate hydrolase family protein [Solirubrobacteraceae bacterium]
MRLARYEDGGSERDGVVDGAHVRALPEGVSLIDVLCAGAQERKRLELGEARPLSGVRLLVPLRPPSVRDFVAFEQHIEGMVMTEGEGASVPAAWYEAPAFYFSNASALFATGEEIAVPPGCEQLDYELEVAAIIGRRGRDLDVESARGHIAGYAIFNDWSARDLQRFDRRAGMGWAKGKDFASTLGPWIVTADELEGHRDSSGRLDLAMTVRRNGEQMGEDTLASAAWSFEQMLVYASRGATLVPGDLIGSGTCGSGCLGELWGRRGELDPPPLGAGDEIEMTVEGIGTIVNRVVAGAAPVGYGEPRRRSRDA